MTTKAKENIVTALYLLGVVILGALGAFILWATLWICYFAGFKM